MFSVQMLDELWTEYEAMEDAGTLPKPGGVVAGPGGLADAAGHVCSIVCDVYVAFF